MPSKSACGDEPVLQVFAGSDPTLNSVAAADAVTDLSHRAGFGGMASWNRWGYAGCFAVKTPSHDPAQDGHDILIVQHKTPRCFNSMHQHPGCLTACLTLILGGLEVPGQAIWHPDGIAKAVLFSSRLVKLLPAYGCGLHLPPQLSSFAEPNSMYSFLTS